MISCDKVLSILGMFLDVKIDDISSITSVHIFLVRGVQILGWVDGSQQIRTLFRI